MEDRRYGILSGEGGGGLVKAVCKSKHYKDITSNNVKKQNFHVNRCIKNYNDTDNIYYSNN